MTEHNLPLIIKNLLKLLFKNMESHRGYMPYMNNTYRKIDIISLLMIFALSAISPCLQAYALTIVATTEWGGVSRIGRGFLTGIVILNGSVYFSDQWGVIGQLDSSTGNLLTEWEAPTCNSSVRFIAAYNGLIFFVECSGNKIGRLDPSTGTFTEWDIPTLGSFPGGIAIDNGLVYFTEFLGNKIGCLDPSTGTFTEWNITTKNS
jgi:streptogramin lyase